MACLKLSFGDLEKKLSLGRPGADARYPRSVAVAEQLFAEHRLLVEACGLVDRSERGKLALTGGEAAEFLNGQLTNELADLEPGQGRFACFLTHKGKMLGDLRVLDLGDELWLDCERAALQALFNMIRRYKLGMDVELHKRTLEQGLLSLIGPRARAVAGAEELPAEEHSNRRIEVDGIAALAVATDVGVDLICDSQRAAELSEALTARGAAPVSEAAAECLRIERGRPRFGIDLDEDTMPQEAGLHERAVSFTKGCYVGQETVARLYYRGRPNRHLRGLRLSAPAEPGAPVALGERAVGTLGSTTVSPAFGPIALALLRREAEPGAHVTVGGDAATVVELPF
jgi:tRNA-modifying protein YgfZ